MADEKPAPQPPLPSWEGERQHSLTGWGKSLSTAVGRKTTRNSDPELGLGSAPNKAAGVPPVAASPPSDNQSMIYRRFGELQARRLLHRRDEIARLQREPEELHDLGVRDGQPGGNLNTRNQHEQFRKRPIRNTLPQETIKRLPDYDPMLLGMKSLTKRPKPSSWQDRSVRQYLEHGPPIHLPYPESTDPRWPEYEKAVQKILDDPATAPWLDGPLDLDWTEISHRQLNWRGRVEADHTFWGSRLGSKLDNWAIGGGILFWISHITAALGFALIANTVSEANRRPTIDWLLGYWYSTTVIIVVQGVLSRFYVYVRKVFLGGTLACAAGFYILKVLLGASAESALTAVPTFITIVLLLIRSM